VEQLDRHISELKEHHELLYRIFSNTGMRLKEALFLEADCLEESRYENLYEIKYKPYKGGAARRRAGLEDCHRVLVPSELAVYMSFDYPQPSVISSINFTNALVPDPYRFYPILRKLYPYMLFWFANLLWSDSLLMICIKKALHFYLHHINCHNLVFNT